MNNKKQLRDFGLIWSLIFFLIAFYPLLNDEKLKLWAIVVALCFLIVSLTFPSFYEKIHFYQAWIKVGNFIGKINSKIIIFILFYFIFFPIGVVLKILKKDLLNKKINKATNTYFVDRKLQPTNMKNQF